MHWYVNYPEAESFFEPMYNVDFSYPAHLHGCLEVSYCIGGALEVTLDEQTHCIKDGEGILIPPNVVHSYHTPESSAYCTILFGKDVLPDFSSMFHRKQPSRYVFSINVQLRQYLTAFYSSDRTLFGAKALLYYTAEIFLQDNTFAKAEKADSSLTRRLLSYLQDNMCNEITLQDVADHLGYSYYYSSKQIRQIFGISFSALLSQYRVANAKSLLRTGKYTVSQAALACGFGSIRTFNRVFLNVTGQTPSQYLSTLYGAKDFQT